MSYEDHWARYQRHVEENRDIEVQQIMESIFNPVFFGTRTDMPGGAWHMSLSVKDVRRQYARQAIALLVANVNREYGCNIPHEGVDRI